MSILSKETENGDASAYGPRSSGRRAYDQAPWYAKVITTSGIGGLIAVMLIVNQQRVAELDRVAKAKETERLAAVISELHESIDNQSKAISDLKTEVLLLRQTLRVQAARSKLDKTNKSGQAIWTEEPYSFPLGP